MPRKKKSDNPNDVPDIENLIKLIAKTLKENMGDADIKNMANIANEFGIDIKLSGVSTKLSKNPNPKESRPTPPQLPPQMPLMQQPPEPFIETIYKKDSVIIDASIPNAKKEEIDVIASQGCLIIDR
ncbi:hypothetical protein M1583_02135, partial [Candidatus Marsarchaeota archaeon]|nr:hypothetical protein [Candidatus Marsarchaeota archaeon]